jgi:hypothetical protein
LRLWHRDQLGELPEVLGGGDEGFAVDASVIKADANRQRSVAGSEGLPPEAANHAVREYLAVLDDAAFGGATPVVSKFLSIADPPHAGQAPMADSPSSLIAPTISSI